MSDRAIEPVQKVTGKGRLYWEVVDSLMLTKRSLLRLPRMPEWLVFATIQPVMFVLLFRYVFGGAIPVSEGSYVNFLMAGIFVQTVAFGSIATGIGLAEDMQKGIVDRFRSLPMSRLAVILGRIMSDVVMNTFIVIVMLVVGIAVGFRPAANPIEWFLAGLLMLMVSFSFSWISAALALKIKTVEAMNSVGFIWLFPLTFASSAFVEVRTMPGWMQGFAENQPITVIIDAVRGLLLDDASRDAFLQGKDVTEATLLGFAWCIGIAAVAIPLAVRMYRRSAS